MAPNKNKNSNKLEKPIDDEKKEEKSDPISVIPCVKSRDDIKRVEQTEDCFILDFDPSDECNCVELISHENNNSPHDLSDVLLVAQKGQFACKDYPHARHMCLKFPFEAKPHDMHCEKCYCYVCDSLAPCKYWRYHCHANDADDNWKEKRTLWKQFFSLK